MNKNLINNQRIQNGIISKNTNKLNNNMRHTDNIPQYQSTTGTNASYYSSAKTAVSSYTGSSVFGIILLVVIILLVLSETYWMYNVYTSKSFETSITVDVMKDVKDAQSKFTIGSGSIPSSTYSNEYSISMWLNIRDYTYNYGKEKIILRRGDAEHPNMEIVLGEKDNDIIVRVKLQNASLNDVGSVDIISKFQDVTKVCDVSQFKDINNINEQRGIDYVNGAELNLQNTTTKLVACDNTVFDKISGNNIDYETIQYNTNIVNDTSQNNAENMKILLEQSLQLKNDVSDTNYSNVINTLSNTCTKTISDNSISKETNVIHDEYFKLISGNNVVSCPKKTIENFDDTNNISNAVAAVLLDLCNISKFLQKQDTADTSIGDLNMMFTLSLELANNVRTSNNTELNIENISNSAKESIAKLIKHSESSSVDVNELINKLLEDVNILKSLSTNTNITSANIDLKTLQNDINSKLTSAMCPLLINGTTQKDVSINLYENIIILIKKTLFSYINNLSNNIQKEYPELINSTSNLNSTAKLNCILDTTTTNTDPTIGTCVYKMIPLQKWVHVIVSVYNQVVDIYIDGQLGSSCVLKGYPSISNLDVNLTPDGGFAGQISKVSFSNTAMTVGKSQSLYYDGPIATDSLLSIIPNWVYYTIISIIFIVLIYYRITSY